MQVASSFLHTQDTLGTRQQIRNPLTLAASTLLAQDYSTPTGVAYST